MRKFLHLFLLRSHLWIGAFLIAYLLGNTTRANADTYTVTNTNDSGAGSLRYAIEDATSGSGNDTIVFNTSAFGRPAPVGGYIINLTSALPDLSKSVTITGPGADICTVRRNSGIFRIFTINSGVTATISGLTITNGTLIGYGGGVNNSGATTLTDCVISGNNAANVGGGGGGGGLYNSLGTLTLNRCIVSGNTGNGASGAGIYTQGGTVNATNTTFAGNGTTQPGGGIYAMGTTVTMSSCTFAGNAGGGASAIYSTGGTATAANTIFGDSGSNCFGVSSGGYNICRDATGPSSSTDRRSLDPKLGPLQNNGGTTPTYALLAGSPALNTGSTSLTTDQRNIARPQGSADDVGAFELSPNDGTPSLLVTTTVDENDGTSDSSYGAGTSLREAITYANTLSSGGTITFASNVTGTITLTSLLPVLTKNITFTGPGASNLAISGGGSVRIFNVASGSTVNISGLTLTRGLSTFGGGSSGGGILNMGNLTLARCLISNNAGNAILTLPQVARRPQPERLYI